MSIWRIFQVGHSRPGLRRGLRYCKLLQNVAPDQDLRPELRFCTGMNVRIDWTHFERPGELSRHGRICGCVVPGAGVADWIGGWGGSRSGDRNV